MKKLLFIISLLLLGASLYAGIEKIKFNLGKVYSITNYVGSQITSYDLGRVEFFVLNGHEGISCVRK